MTNKYQKPLQKQWKTQHKNNQTFYKKPKTDHENITKTITKKITTHITKQ